MILKDALKQIVKDQKIELESLDYGTEREELKNIDLTLPYALIISGIRRCGKSTLLHQLLKKLPDFYYLNFEDTRLTGFEHTDFEKLDEVFKEEYGKSEFYLFDEIQNVDKWELFVRSRLDKQKKFVITGSNASLLSKELGTKLTGRHINKELFPFSFSETLSMKNKKESAEIFEEYLTTGGFPEYLKYRRAEILQELLNDVVQRDIVARYNIRNSRTLKEMAVYLLTNIGKEFSYNGIKTMFGLGSTNTAISFISYFEDSYLLFTVPRFDYSLKKRLVNQKKVYSIDNGLSSINSVSFSSDKGRMLENTVFLQLRRAYRDIFYFKKSYECDFLVREKNKIKMAIQVSYYLNDDNKEREIEGLMEALEMFNLTDGLILTYDQDDKFNIKGKSITVKPVWKWIIENYN
ncbi:MAG: ATP-binding protein [Thermoplasmata archaeon]